MKHSLETNYLEPALTLNDRLLRPLLKMRPSNPGKVVHWWELLTEMRKKALALITPRAAFQLYPLKEVGTQFFINEDQLLGVEVKLRGADKIAFFGITMGEELEKESSRLFDDGSYPEGYLLNVLGTYALTELQSLTFKAAAKLAEAEFLKPGPVMQPGSRNWSLNDQRLFFDLLPLEKMGLTLLESLATSPAKSKTFGCGFWRQ